MFESKHPVHLCWPSHSCLATLDNPFSKVWQIGNDPHHEQVKVLFNANFSFLVIACTPFSWMARVSISQNLSGESLISLNIGGLVKKVRAKFVLLFLIMVFPSGGPTHNQPKGPNLAIGSPEFPLTSHLEKWRSM